ALTARPGEVVLLVALGELVARQKRWQEAIECYRAARALHPHLGIILASALREVGRAAEAEAILRDLMRQQPDNPELYFHHGNALYEQKKPDAAVTVYRQAIALKPDDAKVYNSLGLALHAQKKLDEAEAAYRQAIALKPDDAQA